MIERSLYVTSIQGKGIAKARSKEVIQAIDLIGENVCDQNLQEQISEDSKKSSGENGRDDNTKMVICVPDWRPTKIWGLLSTNKASLLVRRSLKNHPVTRSSTQETASENSSPLIGTLKMMRKRSPQSTNGLKANGERHKMSKANGSGAGSRVESSLLTKEDMDMTPRRHNGRQSKPNLVEHGDRKINMHGPNMNVRHGEASWFYNKRIERKIKQERREKREKKHKEIVEDWISGSNVELGADEIIKGMMEANTSWVVINHCTNYLSPRRVRRRPENVRNA